MALLYLRRCFHLHFIKMHGLGNDFIMLYDMELALASHPDLPQLARRLCARRTGIGADGLMLVRPSDTCDVRMTLYNSDGSMAEMCGNGIRCFAKYAYDNGICKKDELSVETLAGPMLIRLTVENGKAVKAAVNMGVPRFDRPSIPMTGEGDCLEQSLTVLGETFTYSSVLLGVPHTVVFVDDVDAIDIERFGPVIENLPEYPHRTNVNFAQVIDANTVKVRTWERGCGATLACGTGSSSVAACCAASGRTGRSVRILLALGDLDILWAEDGSVIMTGPAEYSFSGEADIF